MFLRIVDAVLAITVVFRRDPSRSGRLLGAFTLQRWSGVIIACRRDLIDEESWLDYYGLSALQCSELALFSSKFTNAGATLG